MEYGSYPDLRKEELYLISRAEYEKQKMITTGFARKLFPRPQLAAAVLDSLSRKGRLIKLQRGKYFLVPIKAPNQQWTPNEFVVAALWMGNIPYYVGYFAMYHYWGLTDQIPQTVHVLNTRRNAEANIGHTAYRAMKVGLSRIYGVQEILIEDETVRVSDRERTLVDFIHRPVGSFEEFSSALKQAISIIDSAKLIEYLIRFPIASLRKRAGFLLEMSGLNEADLQKLRPNLGNPSNFVVLDPKQKSRKGTINKRWGVIVNR
jgi:predicted transcriptional regulator of viral defense system